MAETENSMRKNAFLNNSYDQISTHKALIESLQNNYSYLYELQRREIEYEEFHCFSSNTTNKKNSGYLYVLNGKVYFNIFYNAINISDREAFYRNIKTPPDTNNISGGYTNNENYKTNKFYYKDEFTFEDMISNDIFKKIPIVIIDDMTLYDYKIKFTKDHFRVEVPVNIDFVIESRRDLSNGVYYKEHNVQVLIISTTLCKRSTVTNLSILNNSTNYYLTIENNAIKNSLKNNTFAKNGINLTSEFARGTGLVFVMVHLPNANNTYDFGTNFYPLIPSSTTYNLYTTLLTDEFVDKYNRLINGNFSNKNIKITYVYVKDAHLHRFYYSNSGYNYATKHGSDDSQKYNLIIPYTKNKDFYNQPIPTENFMVYKANYNEETTGRLSSFGLVKNTEILKLHYPNIYEIKCYNSEKNRFYVVYFYNDLIENSHKYENEYKFFYDYIYQKWIRTMDELPLRLEASMTAIFCDTINKSGFTDEEYLEFKDQFDTFMSIVYDNHSHNYNDISYKDYIESNPSSSIRTYEDLTFKHVTTNQYGALRDYVQEQNKLYHYMYHFDISTNELESRERSDTSYDDIFDDNMDPYVFNSVHYVFTFNNKSENRDLKTEVRLYVNNLYVGDFKHYRYLYKDYIYIPGKYFLGASHHIELEVYPSYEHVSPLSFNAINETKEVTLLEPNDEIYPTIADIYCMTPVKHIDQIKDDYISAKDNKTSSSNIDVELPFGDCIPENGNIVRYNSDVVQITEHYDNNVNYNLTPSTDGHRYTRLKKFKITAKKNDILNTTTWFRIAKIPHKIKYVVEKEGYQIIEITERNFHFHPDYLRIFINGKLLPRKNYSYTSDYYYPHIYLFENCKLDDEIYIDISPYRYREIAFFKSLNDYIITSNLGSYIFIDLKEYLNRPFDTQTYDVYIDGYRLSSNEFTSYYDTGLIIFKTMTIHKLAIYEKERDTEYYPKFTQEFSYSDLFSSPYITNIDKYNMIHNYLYDNGIELSGDVTDILPELAEINSVDHAMVYIFYRMELIKKGFVHPDIVQFNELHLNTDYRLIYDNYIDDKFKNIFSFNELINAESGNLLYIGGDSCTFPHLLEMELKPNTYYTIISTGTGSISGNSNTDRSVYIQYADKEYSVFTEHPITILTDSTGILKIGFFSNRPNAKQYISGNAKIKVFEGIIPEDEKTVLHINPDKYIEGEENNTLYKVFGIGHLSESTDQEITQEMINNINTPVIIFDPDLSFNTEG